MTSPPLYNVYDEVQMRLTIGQMCSHCSSNPASASAKPAATSPFSLSPAARGVFSHSPHQRPSIIVASVGMKLSVDHPPLLKRNGFSRGNRFRNQTSNAHARFVFFSKCPKSPGEPAAG